MIDHSSPFIFIDSQSFFLEEKGIKSKNPFEQITERIVYFRFESFAADIS